MHKTMQHKYTMQEMGGKLDVWSVESKVIIELKNGGRFGSMRE